MPPRLPRAIWLGLWLCLAAHVVALASEEQLEVQQLQGASGQQRVALVAPTAVRVQQPVSQGSNDTLVQMIHTQELDEMVSHGGHNTRQHYQKLQALATDVDGNATIAELPTMEAAAASMVESYLEHASVQDVPAVSAAQEAAKVADKTQARLAREAALLRVRVRADKARLKDAESAKARAHKLRAAAELVVKEKAKRIDAANAAFVAAKAAEKKARASISQTGPKFANQALVSLQVAQVKQQLAHLKLERATAALKEEAHTFLVAADKVIAAQKALMRHKGERKAAAVKEAAALDASAAAAVQEKAAVLKQQEATQVAKIRQEEAKAEQRTKRLKKEKARTEKKLGKALAAAKRSGSEAAAMKADQLKEQSRTLAKQAARAAKQLESTALQEQTMKAQAETTSLELSSGELEKHKKALQSVKSLLVQAKKDAQKAGREATRDMTAAIKSKNSDAVDTSKESLQDFQKSESRVKDLQGQLATEIEAVTSLKAQKATRKAEAQRQKQKLSNQKSVVQAKGSAESLMKSVEATVAQSKQVDADAAPEKVALKSEAVAQVQTERDKKRGEETKVHKTKEKLDLARDAQKEAAKLLRQAVRRYMINVTADSSTAEMSSLSLRVAKRIKGLQNAQVRVERFKAAEDAETGRVAKEEVKINSDIAKNIVVLEAKTNPNPNPMSSSKKQAQMLAVATEVHTPAELLKQAQEVLAAKQQAVVKAAGRLKYLAAQVNTSASEENHQKAKFNVKLAAKELRKAMSESEDAKMTVVAQQEVLDTVTQIVDKAANQTDQVKQQQKLELEVAEAKLEQSSAKLADAALLGDSSSMMEVIQQSIADHSQPIGKQKFLNWIECLEAGTEACTLFANSSRLAGISGVTAAHSSSSTTANSTAGGAAVNQTASPAADATLKAVANISTFKLQRIESEAIAKYLRNEDEQAVAANSTAPTAKGMTRQEYQEERMAQKTSSIKSAAVKEELKVSIDGIDNPPEDKGMTSAEFKQEEDKLYHPLVVKKEPTQKQTTAHNSGGRNGLSTEAFSTAKETVQAKE